MSIFKNKTKSELEAGNFIAYSDEPNTVVSGSGGGGGGGGTTFVTAHIEDDLIVPEFSFNDIKGAIDNGDSVFIKSLTSSEENSLSLFRVFNLIWSDSVYGVVVDLGGETLGFEATSPNDIMKLRINP